MRSKYFGEFLVEKGVITEENLVDALIEQIASTPPLCQVISQKKILPTNKVFEAFRFQQDHQVEFMQACKSIGVWTQEVQVKTSSFLDEIRKPLGHILVSKGLIDLKKLTNMLDEFLSELSLAPIKESESISVSAPVKIEELSEKIHPSVLMELEGTFDEKKRRIVRVALSLIQDNAGIDNGICKKLMLDVFKIVRSLNGLLSLLALNQLGEILSAMEGYLTTIQPQLQSRSKEQLVGDTELLSKTIELAWSLRESILENGTEEIFFTEEMNQQQYLQMMQVLRG